MAKKRTSASGKAKKNRSNTKPLVDVVVCLCALFFGVFLLYALLAKDSGTLGQFVCSVSTFLFGVSGSFVLCLTLLFTTFLRLAGYEFFVSKAPLYVTLSSAVLTGVGMHLFDSYYENYKLFDGELAILVAEEGAKGGFLGVFFAKILTSLLSSAGALFFCIAVAILLVFLLFGRTILSFFAVDERAAREKQREKQRESRQSAKQEKAQAKARRVPLVNVNITPRESAAKQKDDTFTDVAGAFVQSTPAPAAKMQQNAAWGEKDTIDKELFETLKRFDDMPAQSVRERTAQEDDEAVSDLKHENLLRFSEDIDEAVERVKKKECAQAIKYAFPSLSLLKLTKKTADTPTKNEMIANAEQLLQTLSNFQIGAHVSNISLGPTIARYELTLDPGVRVSKISRLADDIAMSLAAQSIRIEAPIPGKNAVGVEVPNKTKQLVSLREILADAAFAKSKNPLSVALGRKVAGEPFVLALDSLPHVLIAGATGSGKSVCINDIILSILYHAAPEEVRMILIDPKMVELSVYNGIPHLLLPVVTDPKQAAGALNWAVKQMSERYELFSKMQVRDIHGYNKKMKEQGGETLPKIVIIIDELADLMLVCAQQVEASICRLAQLARAAGIHLVLATQRPSVDVITGLIKANIPSRISFAVSSQVDSRTILDQTGAERLLGKGDMLFSAMGASTIRVQCCFVSDEEITRVVSFLKERAETQYDEKVKEEIDALKPLQNGQKMAYEHDDEFEDEMMDEAIAIARNLGQVSTSLLQRKLRIGYARAGRIVDVMEQRGIVSAAEGSKPRRYLGSRTGGEEEV